MKLYSEAWFLFKTEVNRSRINILIILGLLMFTLLVSAATYYEILGLSLHKFGQIDPLTDYFFILTFSSVGIFLTFIYGGGFKKDLLGDRLAYYRSMPISSEHIVVSRMMSALIGLFISLLVYFIAIVLAFTIFADLRLSDLTYAYPVHALLLFAIMLVLNYLFIWIELIKTYKWYAIFSFVYVFSVLAISVFILASTQLSTTLLLFAYEISDSAPLLVSGISIVTIVASTWLTFKGVTSGLKKRNLG